MESNGKCLPAWLVTALMVLLAILIGLERGGHRRISDNDPAQTPPLAPAASTSPSPTPEVELPVLDYVEVLRNSDRYNGRTVCVAGRISDLYGDNIYFMDRAGFDSELYHRFCCDLSHSLPWSKEARDVYSINDCVIVKGTWRDDYASELREAEVISTGEEARKYVDSFMQQWIDQGEEYARTLPITDYMDIIASPAQFEGARVRTAGQIQAVGTNAATWHKYFHFWNRQINGKSIYFVLRGCPEEMQALCVEDEYVLLSGVVHTSYSTPELFDCYVECVGEEAEAAAKESEASWKERWSEEREAYIAACGPYTYREMARYPDQYEGEQVAVAGQVLLVDYDNILLDVGDGNLVYIDYEGKLRSDPEILPNDTVTFYGECAHTRSYDANISPLGGRGQLPLIVAAYVAWS